MPDSDLHKSKKKKNLTILALIAGWVVLIWIITVIKVSNGG